ncbi:hypothetical protein PUV54_05305 [Hyphococcus flavus]|uniref:DUF2059 domain-containing protein n=1 Tax=Hyphococcus flavus TaxID=1866326 RepID=A0AAE9ZDM2_9PROT|nr:hypothetical protein [Hyphococcus flavus]WDI32611.1 hypothetical protein PUV54_05305 [Hyphococcus flavus]
MLKSLFVAFGAVALMTVNAVAADAPLTEDQAKRFVESLPALDALGESLEADGKMDELKIDPTPKAGQAFKPYSQAVSGLKEKYPSDYAKLDSAVKPHGFSASEWGLVGDRVITAYLAIKMEEENPQAMAQMQAMDKSMLEMMPKEMQDQFNQVLVMMETIENVSPEDRAAVQSVKGQLDEYMEDKSRS